jgi:major membrane immunogen (membrane-anchored lipoprotein)
MDLSSVFGEREMVGTKKKDKERGKISSLVLTINPFPGGDSSLDQLNNGLMKRDEMDERDLRDNDMVEIMVKEGKVIFTKMKKEDEL